MVKNPPGEGRTTFNRLKGAKVFSTDGELFGHLDDLEVNSSTLNPTHIIVHKGFFGGDVRINLKYVESVSPDGIRLWISPVEELVGAKVYDKDGKEMGIVKEAEKSSSGKLEYIRVSVRIVTKCDEPGHMKTYIIPVIPFEDMSLSVPHGTLGDEIASPVDVKATELLIRSNEITSVHRKFIVLSKTRDDYIDENRGNE